MHSLGTMTTDNHQPTGVYQPLLNRATSCGPPRESPPIQSNGMIDLLKVWGWSLMVRLFEVYITQMHARGIDVDRTCLSLTPLQLPFLMATVE